MRVKDSWRIAEITFHLQLTSFLPAAWMVRILTVTPMTGRVWDIMAVHSIITKKSTLLNLSGVMTAHICLRKTIGLASSRGFC